MDESTLLWLITSLTAVLFVVGVPVFLCIGVWTTLASLAIGFTISNIGITSYQGISSYALLAMPLFILTGDLIGAGGIAVRLSALAAALLRPVRGGMALATISTCSMFAAISGSNSATVATIGRIMIPEMKKQGYNVEFAAANAASGGIVGILIPPSVLMVVYGFMTNLSVIDLFTAGWGPGICVSLGLAAAWFGGLVDVIIIRIMDLIMAIPSLVLAILIIAIIGPSLTNTIVAVTIVYLPRYVRLVRASALAELTRDYVTAAKVAGVGPFRLMTVTVLPNCLAPLIVQAALGVSDAILEAAGLGFLGLGAQPPTPEWGAMLADTRDLMLSHPWVMAFPGLCILVTVMAINLMGDGLRDALDPRLRKS